MAEIVVLFVGLIAVALLFMIGLISRARRNSPRGAANAAAGTYLFSPSDDGGIWMHAPTSDSGASWGADSGGASVDCSSVDSGGGAGADCGSN